MHRQPLLSNLFELFSTSSTAAIPMATLPCQLPGSPGRLANTVCPLGLMQATTHHRVHTGNPDPGREVPSGDIDILLLSLLQVQGPADQSHLHPPVGISCRKAGVSAGEYASSPDKALAPWRDKQALFPQSWEV